MKPVLPDEILLKVEKPARYIGGEINAVYKDPRDIDIRFAMCFPDLYEIGMSHLGIQIIYSMLNERPDVWCERVYSPWIDLHAIMKEKKIPLFALESQEPVSGFDFLGITLQYEMCYTNILQILDLSGIPMHAKDRTKDHPIVIGGGPCTYNPEPVAVFFDLFYIGEAETGYDALLDLYKEYKNKGFDRRKFLLEAGKLPGIYAPLFYETTYHADGTIAAFTPTEEGLGETIRKEICMDLTHAHYPTKQIVPFIRVTQDRAVLEIQRGCIRGCRFCQAGMIYRPLREKEEKELERIAEEILANTGNDEISLSSLSSSDYSKLPELIEFLIAHARENHVNISLPSLRIDAFSLDVMSKVQDVRKSSLTFAPEAGSQRLRNVINKGLTEDDILKGAAEAFKGGWTRVKLYFMLGLPTETEEDLKAIPELCNEIAKLYYELIPKEERKGRIQIVASSSFFVPKPFTPFQWAAMDRAEDFLKKADFVNHTMHAQLNQRSIKYNWHDAKVSILEGIMARGDRRLSDVIEAAYRHGALFDAWTETFSQEPWDKAFAETGIAGDFYVHRERDPEEILPWDFIDTGVTREFLLKEWENAKAGIVTRNCRDTCNGCGAAEFGGGICYAH
ncbi:MAG: TIGR03960 family B12-binding radical SAM protein [Lachnospiraceae bacterium]|nr:TIGR03960 family B12-binding radical SAM protein [Lachnospiraceae bacterium]